MNETTKIILVNNLRGMSLSEIRDIFDVSEIETDHARDYWDDMTDDQRDDFKDEHAEELR